MILPSVCQRKIHKFREVKSGPKPKLFAKEQLFIYSSCLKNEFTLSHVLSLFQPPKATVLRYIITWKIFLYFSVDSIPVWPPREQINEEMQEIFKRT